MNQARLFEYVKDSKDKAKILVVKDDKEASEAKVIYD